ncbi:hypothetical protein CN150_25635 [Sinorhizobium meliloti]|nr:hypothetical protein CN150_25635 [Sinorhizobium meliloti]
MMHRFSGAQEEMAIQQLVPSPRHNATACTYLLLSSPSRIYSGVAASVFPAVARLADGSLGSNPYALTLALERYVFKPVHIPPL